MDRQLFELSFKNEGGIYSPESKLKISFPQLWGLIIIVFAIATSYALTLFAVNNLTDNVHSLKSDGQNLTVDIGSLKTDVKELKISVQDLKNDIRGLQSSIEKMTTSVSDHNDMLENIIVHDSLMIKQVPPRIKHLYFSR